MSDVVHLGNVMKWYTTLYSPGQPTVPGQDLNPGSLSLEASALMTEQKMPDGYSYQCDYTATIEGERRWLNCNDTHYTNNISKQLHGFYIHA